MFEDDIVILIKSISILLSYNWIINLTFTGPLLKKIANDIKNKIDSPSNKRKMFIYAGHDSTVANLMMALRVWEEQIPVYNIMTLIELHEIDQVYGLKVHLS